MTRAYSSAELASEAGVTPDLVAWLVSLDVIDPATPEAFTYGDVFRAKIVGALLAAGFTKQQVEASFSTGGLSLSHLDRYEFGEAGERSARTFDQFGDGLVDEAAGILPAVYQAFGLPPPAPSTHLPLAEEGVLEEFLRVWHTGGDGETALRAARLAGEGTRLAAMGWPELFADEIAAPARDRWLHREIDEYPSDVIDAGSALARLLPRLVLWLMDRFLEQLVTAGIVANFENVLASRGLAPPPEPADPAVVFVDIAGYTRATEELGDDAAARMATGLQRQAEAVAADRGGRVVKMLGDGALLHFPNPAAGVGAALELMSAIDTELGVQAHAGVHVGRVIERDRDLYGRTVNLAARVAAVAPPGQVLVTEAVVKAVDGPTYEPVDTFHLKGIADPVPLFEVPG
ncbi:MAG: adenylate/guanylate cyclase domain-containing protein [Acidimicrobiia bacterium]